MSLLRNIAAAVGVGFAIGATASTLVGQSSPLPMAIAPFEYITVDTEVAEAICELMDLLCIDGSVTMPRAFFDIVAALNVLLGFDYLIDAGKPVSLDLNYAAQGIRGACTRSLNQLLAHRFRIPSVGVSVCAIVERLQEKVVNITYNINQELQIRIMEGDF